MRNHTHRVLSEFKMTPAQWAILFTASYYLPAPVNQFVIEAQHESDENFSTDQIMEAFEDCLDYGWICSADHMSHQQFDADEWESDSSDRLETGIVLTDAGNELKEAVSLAILETVEID